MGSDSKLSGASVQKDIFGQDAKTKSGSFTFLAENPKTKSGSSMFFGRDARKAKKEFGEWKEDRTALKMEVEGSEQAVKLKKRKA